ncbi:MAG: adaptor protein MecA [Agathobacter sp.]
MKIEKINENQIRCTLTKEDLADRQIKISELAYGSEKARSLFRDMIEQANYEFGFEAEDIPLMIEAIPLSGENIILQITKVEYPEEIDTRFSKFSEGEEEEETVSDNNLFADTQGADDILDVFQKMKEDLKQQVEEKEKQVDKTAPAKPLDLTKMFEFSDLEQLERLAHVLGSYYDGKNDVYKDEKKNRFYLIVHKSQHSPEEFNKVCNIISEYSVQKKYSCAMEAHFEEHGKLILKGNALKVLGSLEK